MCIYTCIYIIHAYICLSTCIYMCIYVCVYTYKYVYVHVYIHIHINVKRTWVHVDCRDHGETMHLVKKLQNMSMYECIYIHLCAHRAPLSWINNAPLKRNSKLRGFHKSDLLTPNHHTHREVGGWGRDPQKCTGRDWGMGSSTI